MRTRKRVMIANGLAAFHKKCKKLAVGVQSQASLKNFSPSIQFQLICFVPHLSCGIRTKRATFPFVTVRLNHRRSVTLFN